MDAQSAADLQDDFTELRVIVDDNSQRLARLGRPLERHARPGTASVIGEIVARTSETFRQLANDLKVLQATRVDDSLDKLVAEKKRIADIVRSLQGVTGSLLAATDWQAPSFVHAECSQAGTQTGRITGTVNDYKRDHHADATNYERCWRQAYIDAPLRFPPQVYVTASGMAAFSTVLTTLATEGKINGPILAGQACYFENKLLLEKFFPGLVHYVDEMNTDSVLAAIAELQPAAIFFDTLGNTEDVAAPDMERLVPKMIEAVTRPTILVLDATGTATSYQPLRNWPRGPCKLNLVVIESLLKYHQFGFDRVSAGIMWRTGLTPLGLFGNRMHLGTGLVDASVLALPQPNRKLFDKRLRRMSRNANLVARALEEHAKTTKMTALAGVAYPGLPSHPAYEWMSKRNFQGSFLVFKLKPQYCFTAYYKTFLKLAVDEARKAGVDLNGGSSFGFDTTRVYLTALYAAKHATPFIRVSVGTETLVEVERLITALTRAVDKLAYRLPL
jgi:cystathionine beta-lyase/cystathionine gamma-synthase